MSSIAAVAQELFTIGDALDLLMCEVRVDCMASCSPGVKDNAHIALPNGWIVSVGFGTCHHCSNYGPRDRDLSILKSPDCEVAVFCADGSWFRPHEVYSWENVPARTTLAVVDAVATYQDGGPCPCPDCVSGRALT